MLWLFRSQYSVQKACTPEHYQSVVPQWSIDYSITSMVIDGHGFTSMVLNGSTLMVLDGPQWYYADGPQWYCADGERSSLIPTHSLLFSSGSRECCVVYSFVHCSALVVTVTSVGLNTLVDAHLLLVVHEFGVQQQWAVVSSSSSRW